MSSKEYQKNILITGGSGFIGGNIILYLLNKYPNYFILNIDKLDYCSQRNKQIEKLKNYKFVQGNILEYSLIINIIDKYNIDTIIHMAANSHVDNSFGNSLEFTKNNIVGTHTLLECSKVSLNIKKFIYMSTDEVLGNTPNNILEPTNPYAATKAAAEHIVDSYRISFNLPCIIVRCNNVYGPNQYPEKIIPKFIKLLRGGKDLTIHGDGTNKRKYIHVDDVCSAYDIIMHKGEIGEVYGIGNNQEYTNLQIAQFLIDITKSKSKIVFIEDRPFNDTRYWVDTTKLTQLGWKSNIEILEGINSLIK